MKGLVKVLNGSYKASIHSKWKKVSLEFTLGAMRWARDIARSQKNVVKPCYICGIHEFLEARDGQYIARNPYIHLLFECTLEMFLSQ